MALSTTAIFGKKAMNRIDARDYVDWAVEALVAGKDGFHLRMLAGLDPMGSLFEAEEHFRGALRELKIAELDGEGSLKAYACDLAERIIAGTLEVKAGVKELFQICVTSDYSRELMIWLYLDDALVDIEAGVHPITYESATAENFDDLVRMEARRFLQEIRQRQGA